MTMKYVDEFRDPGLITAVAHEIRRTVDPARHYRIMEVCGGHTHAIYRHGLHDVLPENVELVHGPGCPVCVLPTGRVDDGLAIAAQPNVALACFGDMGPKNKITKAACKGRATFTARIREKFICPTHARGNSHRNRQTIRAAAWKCPKARHVSFSHRNDSA